MNNNINQLAKNFIEGEWLYLADEKTLKKTFASNKELSALKLIDQEGYLDSSLKTTIQEMLSDVIATSVVGPFNDSDIFSGDIVEDDIFYNIELHQVKAETIEALKKIPNITIKS